MDFYVPHITTQSVHGICYWHFRKSICPSAYSSVSMCVCRV